MKFISWNVNGLRACVGKDFEQSFNTLNADFFCLQETKMQAGQLDLQFSTLLIFSRMSLLFFFFFLSFSFSFLLTL